ncbi:DUF3263 domain-containing protein [Homoserinibacter sp. YIM 151385]|uniref:DUF3263 domain-containing protein n=1 Tax=Homoserinibacter sp. YIM 151385 TaxID=2985506 RepID=UPI0022F0195D|nr:DUF3263 domain-containing protein [Homoserinibacter sp. YIM 151385]WBU37936.1 DUF3263 domain-containing protein [Homoserinibacter sp. YIM 151385]
MTAVLPTTTAPIQTARPGTLASAQPVLAELDRRILDFEVENPVNGQAKNRLILSTFSMPVRRYFHLLQRVIETPMAMEEYPQVVARCLRDPRLQADETLWGRAHAG